MTDESLNGPVIPQLSFVSLLLRSPVDDRWLAGFGAL
jgi:hypothetical protein